MMQLIRGFSLIYKNIVCFWSIRPVVPLPILSIFKFGSIAIDLGDSPRKNYTELLIIVIYNIIRTYLIIRVNIYN